MVEEGILDPTDSSESRQLGIYESEYDVADMAECEGYISADDGKKMMRMMSIQTMMR